VHALDLDDDENNTLHDIPMQLEADFDHSDYSDGDSDVDIQARHARLCALPPGDEAIAESGEGGETDLLLEMESVVRP